MFTGLGSYFRNGPTFRNLEFGIRLGLVAKPRACDLTTNNSQLTTIRLVWFRLCRVRIRAQKPERLRMLPGFLGLRRAVVKKTLPAFGTAVGENGQNPPRKIRPRAGDFAPRDSAHPGEAASRAQRPARILPPRLASSTAADMKPVAAIMAPVRPHPDERQQMVPHRPPPGPPHLRFSAFRTRSLAPMFVVGLRFLFHGGDLCAGRRHQ